MNKTFKKEYLIGLGLPDECADEDDNEGEIVSDVIVDHSRWSIQRVVTFKLPGQTDGSAWTTGYSVGATESQDERPWEYDDDVECTLVREVEVTVNQWKEAES